MNMKIKIVGIHNFLRMIAEYTPGSRNIQLRVKSLTFGLTQSDLYLVTGCRLCQVAEIQRFQVQVMPDNFSEFAAQLFFEKCEQLAQVVRIALGQRVFQGPDYQMGGYYIRNTKYPAGTHQQLPDYGQVFFRVGAGYLQLNCLNRG